MNQAIPLMFLHSFTACMWKTTAWETPRSMTLWAAFSDDKKRTESTSSSALSGSPVVHLLLLHPFQFTTSTPPTSASQTLRDDSQQPLLR